jgi:zeaxanthin glucosyltransferase
MAHIGVFCLPMPSHINLFLVLGDALARRGHRITFFGLSGNKAKIRDAGFDFHSTEPDHLPLGTLGKMMREMGHLASFKAMRLQGQFDELRYQGILQKGPALAARADLDGLIVDQAEACSGSVADAIGLPWVSVANGLCLNAEPRVPPFFTCWSYSENPFAIARNRLAYAGIRWASRSIAKIINRHRKRWALQPFARLDDTFSPFAQIAQQNSEFDFPRRDLPNCFHYVGPIRAASRPASPFPWERLDGRPLIYASFGTLVNRHKHLYRTVAESCVDLDVQLVISLGGAGDLNELADLPGDPLVVEFAPQAKLLTRAVLAITHAGLNTALECLTAGVPLVAIPIAFEQPGVAARIRWTGTGEFVTLRNVTPEKLKATIVRVLSEPAYRHSAVRMRVAINQTGGCDQAAGIIEQVICTRQPVLTLNGKYALKVAQ